MDLLKQNRVLTYWPMNDSARLQRAYLLFVCLRQNLLPVNHTQFHRHPPLTDYVHFNKLSIAAEPSKKK